MSNLRKRISQFFQRTNSDATLVKKEKTTREPKNDLREDEVEESSRQYEHEQVKVKNRVSRFFDGFKKKSKQDNVSVPSKIPSIIITDMSDESPPNSADSIMKNEESSLMQVDMDNVPAMHYELEAEQYYAVAQTFLIDRNEVNESNKDEESVDNHVKSIENEESAVKQDDVTNPSVVQIDKDDAVTNEHVENAEPKIKQDVGAESSIKQESATSKSSPKKKKKKAKKNKNK